VTSVQPTSAPRPTALSGPHRTGHGFESTSPDLPLDPHRPALDHRTRTETAVGPPVEGVAQQRRALACPPLTVILIRIRPLHNRSDLKHALDGAGPSRYHRQYDDSSKSDAPTMANGSIHSCSVIHRGSLQNRSTGRARLESSIRGLARDGTGIPSLECLSNALSQLPETPGLGCTSLDPSPHRDCGRLPRIVRIVMSASIGTFPANEVAGIAPRLASTGLPRARTGKRSNRSSLRPTSVPGAPRAGHGLNHRLLRTKEPLTTPSETATTDGFATLLTVSRRL
jgi:hypothetical protein